MWYLNLKVWLWVLGNYKRDVSFCEQCMALLSLNYLNFLWQECGSKTCSYVNL
jgi:hypothetical protein